MLKRHCDMQLEEQYVALSEARQCLQETLEAEVRGTGTRIKVKRLVTSLYSMYKRARADLAGRLTGIPLEDVPDSQVAPLPACYIVCLCCPLPTCVCVEWACASCTHALRVLTVLAHELPALLAPVRVGLLCTLACTLASSVMIVVQFVALCKLHRIIDQKTDVAKLNVVFSQGSEGAGQIGNDATGRAAESRLCYQILGIVHSLWAPVPGSMKDFISTPKRNGYRGLHSVMLTLGCKAALPVEVIIHTEPMHWLAEFGIAAESWVRASEDMCMQQSRRKGHHRAAVRAGLPLKAESGLSEHRNGTANGSAVSGKSVKSVPKSGSRAHNGAAPTHGTGSNGASSNGASSNGAGRLPARGGNNSQPQNGAAPVGAPRIAYEDIPDVEELAGADESAGGVVGSGRWEFALSLFATDPFSNSEDFPGGEDVFERTVATQTPQPGMVVPAARQLGDEAISRRVNWLQSIRHWQEEFLGSVSATEFVEVIQSDLLTQTVFAFTPAGDILRLPKGATVVDFAYHVHSEVGNNMVSAKVNGRMVGAQYELHNADVVEIIQYAAAKSSLQNVQRHRDWLPLARTQSARHKLSRFLRASEAPSDSEKTGEIPLPCGVC